MNGPRQPRPGEAAIPRRALWLVGLGITALAAASSPAAPGAPLAAITVPADAGGWIDSGINVGAGQAITVQARGTVWIHRPCRNERKPFCVGPEGTYLFADSVLTARFPLPAAESGPAPCYCLIGRIGPDGLPFYLGRTSSRRIEQGGRLMLALNTDRPGADRGSFQVRIGLGAAPEPIGVRRRIGPGAPAGCPLPGAAVVVFYVDGLRPDVVREMAAMGHLPTIRRYFVDGGVDLAAACTVFPSNTITSNGTLWTGRFSDRHGLKFQEEFSRRTLRSIAYLEPYGIGVTADVLSPHGLNRVSLTARTMARRVVMGRADADRWRRAQTTDTPALYDYLKRRGAAYATASLPIMPDSPPPLYSRYLWHEAPYFQAHQAIFRIDETNAAYALQNLLRTERQVTVIWMPDVDEISHHCPRGQFGTARGAIARADVLIGRCIAKLERQGRLDRTYLMLISDHGHEGGRTAVLQRYDLADEFFYEPRRVTPDGRWVGGGLGLSVRQDRWTNRHPGDRAHEFVFYQGEHEGVGRIFLPYAAYRSGQWMRPNRFFELTHYVIDPHRPAVDLIDRLTHVRVPDPVGGAGPDPVDLVLARLTDQSLVVATGRRGWAVIERRRDPGGEWVYRYQVVRSIHPAPTDPPSYEPDPAPRSDPLRLVGVVPPAFFSRFHTERQWLAVTAATPYPDSVVALSRHVLWAPEIADREAEYAPDLIVTASRGWVFGGQGEQGTDHGHPFASTMHSTWFIAGPNIPRGAVLEEPCRTVDLLPTILDITGTPFQPDEVDGRPLRTIYTSAADPVDPPDRGIGGPGPAPRSSALAARSLLTRGPSPLTAPSDPAIRTVPLYWSDVDLHAWAAVPVQGRPEYPDRPRTIHDPLGATDLHSLVYDAVSVSDLEIVRMADDAVTLGRGRPIDGGLERFQDRLDQAAGRQPIMFRWLADGVNALQLRHLTPGDLFPSTYYYPTDGNWLRVNLALDWAQDRAEGIDRLLARPMGLRSVLGIPLLNRGIDRVQAGANEVHRYLQQQALWVGDKMVLEGIEAGVDGMLNRGRAVPAEVLVAPGADR